MAQFLYRLGLASAKRAWLVVIVWLLVLGTSVGLMVAGGAKLSDNISIAGLPAQKVIDQLKTSFASASGGSAQIVFHKTNGMAFTDTEGEAISAQLKTVGGFAGVTKAVNPFTTQAQLDKQRTDVADGQRKITTAKNTIARNQSKLNGGRVKLQAVEADLNAKAAKLDAAIAQAKAAGAPASMIAPLQAGRQKITAGLAQVASSRAALAAGQKKLDAGLSKNQSQRRQAPVGAADSRHHRKLWHGSQRRQDRAGDHPV